MAALFFGTLASLILSAVVYCLISSIRQNSKIGDIPGPSLAAFSNLWLMYQCRRGRRYLAVDAAHKKYGKFVRIQPNHVSIADADAISIIYGHGGGWLKSEYYDAFVSIQRGLFNTRSRAEHTRKRKTIAHTFSAKNVAQFEPYIAANLAQLIEQWDRLCRAQQSGLTAAAAAAAGGEGEEAYAEIDALHWMNYLAFDIIGDLAFGAPFGVLSAGKDVATVRVSPDAPVTTAPAIEVLNRRGEVSATLGCMPWLKPYARWLPDAFFRNGVKAVENLAGIAKARVGARLVLEEEKEAVRIRNAGARRGGIGYDDDDVGGPGNGDDDNEVSQRTDLLARLMQGRDDRGLPLSRDELTAEALTQLIAGSDTTSNTATACLYHLLANPRVLARLQTELDAVEIPDGGRTGVIPTDQALKPLPYLQAVINETLRHHSTSSLGLPRVVPPGFAGTEICGRTWAPGTVLSVPTYTIHHDTEIWGPDAAVEFRPERFLPHGLTTARQKMAFIPFSTGPRACVGRNLAEMELRLIVATVVRNYDFKLLSSSSRGRGQECNDGGGGGGGGGEGLSTREGFLRKPVGLRVGVRKRGRT